MPDPLSMVTAIGGILSSCVKSAKALIELYDTYDNANNTLLSMHANCYTMRASVASLEELVLEHPHESTDYLKLMDRILPVCELLSKCLDENIEKMSGPNSRGEVRPLTRRSKVAFALWREMEMKPLLRQLVDHDATLNTYLQTRNL
jgi:hypothetical protein